MSRMQAESFPVAVLRRDRQQEDVSFAELSDCAQRFSPRIESIASPQRGKLRSHAFARYFRFWAFAGRCAADRRKRARQSAAAMGYEANVAAAHNAYAAVLAARGISGAMAIAPVAKRKCWRRCRSRCWNWMRHWRKPLRRGESIR